MQPMGKKEGDCRPGGASHLRDLEVRPGGASHLRPGGADLEVLRPGGASHLQPRCSQAKVPATYRPAGPGQGGPGQGASHLQDRLQTQGASH